MNKVKFGELFEYKKKSKIKAGDGLKINEGKYPFYTSSNTLSKSIDEFQFSNPSLIFGTGGMPSVHFCEGKFAVSTDCLVAQPKDRSKVYVQYLYYFFTQNNMRVLQKGFKGAGLKHISRNYIDKIQIPLPPLKTQKHIAQILDDAAALRDKTKQLLIEYDLLAQSLFLDMFGDPVTNPKGWELVDFKDVLVLKRGFDLPVQDRTRGDFPIMASNGILDWHNEFKVKGPGVVTGRSGTLGKVHFIENDYWPLNTALYSQDLKRNNPLYILFLLRNFRVERFSRGAGVPTLNRNLVHSEKIISVPIELQNQFAEKIALIEQQKALAKQELQESEDLFNCLLQKAFKGELV